MRRRTGTASLALDMMDEGTKTRSSLQISEELAQLGAELGTGSNLDVSTVSLSALKANLDPSLAIYADVILNPSFPQEDFARLQKLQLARIQREKVTPIQMALRVFPRYLYGANHAYGLPFTGSGTEASVSKLTREDLSKFHQAWFKPNNATLVVVGDLTLAEISPKLEKLFKDWKKGDSPKKNLSEVKLPVKAQVYLIDRPGSLQSVILAGHVAPSTANPDEIAITTMNNILGGNFTSRLNMNLREDKHWSYGAGSVLINARGQRPYIFYGPVQTDKTKESMVEMAKEIRAIAGDRPVSNEEFTKAKSNQVLELPGSWETIGAVNGSIGNVVRFGYPDDYYQTYAAKVQNLQLTQVAGEAKKILHPDNLVWIVVGDREKIEAGVRELNFGELQVVDTEGNLVK